MRPAELWRRPGVRFTLFGSALHAGAWALGFGRPPELGMSWLWWLSLGGLAWLAADRLGPQAARRTWVGLAALFGLDIGTQAMLLGYFGSVPQPGVIAESLAHTSLAETAGFLGEQWRAITRALLLTLATTGAAWRWAVPPALQGRAARRALWALLGLCVLLHFNPTMRRGQPLLRWVVVYSRHLIAQREIAQLDQARAALWKRHADWQVQRLDDAPRTAVLVIGESGTRLNWGLLGYPRDTTAPLAQAIARLPGEFVVFGQAWSAQAFTLPSLRTALTPATDEHRDDWLQGPDVVLLAKAAGYHVTWLSNQPVSEGWFASMARSADRSVFINKGNWRDSSATDHDLLPALEPLLAGAVPERELLVVHLLGQHFHFDQRCPAALKRWAPQAPDDAVTQSLRAAGRSASTIAARNAYDDAVFCGADVLARLMTRLHQQRPGRVLELLYFSDHGQEVGHGIDFAGHSESTAAGYAIPVLWWTRDGALPAGRRPSALADRPFRLDWADHAVQHLLGIRSALYRPELDLLGPDYAPPGATRPAALDRSRERSR
jgi:heptose-I-phosphate ethanolaminephosphotransferase